MPVWKLQTQISADSQFVRDRAVITPHFDDSGIGTDPQGLCDDLAEALASYFPTPREVTVKAYDAQGSIPVLPQGERTVNLGLAPASSHPRELAVCLSFYGTRNVPRQRGRLYLPLYALGFTGQMPTRPSATIMSKVMALAPIFEQLGGPDVDWCLYSKTTDKAWPVTNYWCDDEWDVVRSRGLRSTTRQLGTTSEA